MERIRIGYIGAGTNTRERHLPGFAALEGVESVVVANRSRTSSEKVAADFGIPRVADDWRAVVSDPGVDAVCIGTWPVLHAEATIAALGAGKHVLCEARMAMNLDEALAMEAAAARRSDLVAQLVPAPFSLRFDDRVREWVAASGGVVEIRLRDLGGNLADPRAPLTWRLDPAKSGMNCLTLGIFHETVLRWIPGDPAWLSARAGFGAPARQDPETGAMVATSIPESLTVFGEWSGGAGFVYDLSALVPGPAVKEAVLAGRAESCRVDFGSGRVRTSGGVELAAPDPAGDDGWRVEEAFIASIRTGAPVRQTTFADGVRYMRFTEAVALSVRARGERVYPDELVRPVR